jgi:hypothetical protein
VTGTLASHASAEEKHESAAMRPNTGVRLGVGPEVLFPTDGGPAGAGAVVEGRYGFALKPIVLAPGGRIAGDMISGRFVLSAMPTVRITLPIGPLAPYGVGGLGAAALTNPSQAGLAVLGGGGLMIHVGPIVAFGAEITYEHISGTEFSVLAVGPTIQLGT